MSDYITDLELLAQLNGGGDETFKRMQVAESNNRDYDSQGRPLTSSVGAMFKNQVLPSTANNPGYGIRPAQSQTPEEYNRVGQEYFQAMLKEFNGDKPAAVAAYNAGPGVVKKNIQANQGQLNVGALPRETQGYLNKVLDYIIPSAHAGETNTGKKSHGYITDPALLAKLNSTEKTQQDSGYITDPELLKQLNAPKAKAQPDNTGESLIPLAQYVKKGDEIIPLNKIPTGINWKQLKDVAGPITSAAKEVVSGYKANPTKALVDIAGTAVTGFPTPVFGAISAYEGAKKFAPAAKETVENIKDVLGSKPKLEEAKHFFMRNIRDPNSWIRYSNYLDEAIRTGKSDDLLEYMQRIKEDFKKAGNDTALKFVDKNIADLKKYATPAPISTGEKVARVLAPAGKALAKTAGYGLTGLGAVNALESLGKGNYTDAAVEGATTIGSLIKGLGLPAAILGGGYELSKAATKTLQGLSDDQLDQIMDMGGDTAIAAAIIKQGRQKQK